MSIQSKSSSLTQQVADMADTARLGLMASLCQALQYGNFCFLYV